MGIIPAGSGNGLAHHLGIPIKIKDAVEVLNRQKIERIDTCLADDVFFVSIAGIGFDAKVARQFAKTRKRGWKTYAWIVLKEYASYKPGKYTLTLDGKEKKVKAFFISFANSSQFGYNTRIAPSASIVDGKIDVCIVEKPPVTAFPGIVHMMFRQRIHHSKYLETCQAADIIVERKQGNSVNIDGEPIKMGKKIHFSISPASLKVIVP
jgi:YegS/Rv2252/BmrU family lipid kinase